MMRSLFTLLAGAVLALAAESFLPRFLRHTPPAVQTAAASLGIKEPPAPANYAQTGPLAASIQAETRKNYDQALAELAAYQQARGDAFIASERAGWLYYLKGAYPQAEQAYTAASRVHSLAINPALGLLNVAQATKDGRKIQQAAEAVIRIEPSNYRANMALAGIFYATRDYRAAAFAYRRLLTSYPDDMDVRSGLAWAEIYTGDTRDALTQFESILSVYPDYPFAKQGLKAASVGNGPTASLH